MINRSHPHAERGADCYETPAVAVEALLRVEQLPRVIWEPACGPGSIVRVLRERGHTVHATDLIDYDSPDQDAVLDFLTEQRCPSRSVRAIITNPPYKLADRFVAHALALCPRVIMLLRLAYLEGVRRSPLIDGKHLARVHIFKNRLPMMHRDGWKGPRATSMISFAWFAWDHAHEGEPTISRITWGEQ